MSYRVLRSPARHAIFLPWVREVSSVLEEKHLSYLEAAVQAKGYFPDYLTPTPTTPLPSFDEELERLRTTPSEEVRRDALHIYAQSNVQHSAVLKCYFDQPEKALERLTDDLKVYWETALVHHWPHIQKRLEGDVLRRAQQLALEGSHALFSQLHPLLSVEGNVLRIERKHDRQVRPEGLGIILVPIFFSWPDLYYLAEPQQRPLIGYSPAGTALWERNQLNANESLTLALGIGRAKVLGALQIPKTPSTLAADTGVTTGAVSQQLKRLRKAGLVEQQRLGRNTFYRLTRRGSALLELFRK